MLAGHEGDEARRVAVLAEAPLLDIARDFSRTPGGRLIKHGPFSGELFRQDYLKPALDRARARGEKLTVRFDGVASLPPSFLEEAFGGIVRQKFYSKADLRDLLNIDANAQRFRLLRDLAWKYINEAKPGEI